MNGLEGFTLFLARFNGDRTLPVCASKGCARGSPSEWSHLPTRTKPKGEAFCKRALGGLDTRKSVVLRSCSQACWEAMP
eukprot:674867-Amphidinium_carterae.1